MELTEAVLAALKLALEIDGKEVVKIEKEPMPRLPLPESNVS